MRYAILVLILMALAIPAGAIGIDLPTDAESFLQMIQPDAVGWASFHNLSTGENTWKITADWYVVRKNDARLLFTLKTPADFEKFDLGFGLAVKGKSPFKLGISTQSWFNFKTLNATAGVSFPISL